MCTEGVAGEGLTVAAALRVMDAALDYLNGGGLGEVEGAGLGSVLESLAGLAGKFAAARAAALARFDAAGGYRADGYGSAAAWLAARARTTRRAAGARDQLAALLPVRELVLGAEHPNTMTTRHDLDYWTRKASGGLIEKRSWCYFLC